MSSHVRCSVVICTFNGEARIRSTLSALARCVVDFPVEIILVDNNSHDATAAVAQEFWDQCVSGHCTFRAVHEAEPGVAFARRAGVRAARGDIIVFCDDDNWLHPEYLKIAVEVMQNPEIGAAGGRSEPRIDGPIPSFMYGAGPDYAIGMQALETGDVTDSRGFLWTAGLAVRRLDMVRLYECPGFPLLSGRKGTCLAAGEDAEICAGLVLLGLRLYYDERLRFEHFIEPHRLTIEYLKRLRDGIKASGAALQYYAVLKELRSRGPIANVLMNGLRWLRWMGNENYKWRYRFAFLTAARLTTMMTETERAFYKVHRHLLASHE
jgi:glycosyltransferase involved in cell wall biosynthesis